MKINFWVDVSWVALHHFDVASASFRSQSHRKALNRFGIEQSKNGGIRILYNAVGREIANC
jgi:hypothetical protein